jgi:hypothetical protein
MLIETVVIVVVAPALFLVGQAVLSPLETLLWSAGWIGDDPDHHLPSSAGPRPRMFVVYLDGIGKTAPRETRVARELVGKLSDRVRDVAVLTGVLPYAMTNRAMTSRPISGRYWRFLATHRLRPLLFINNALQTFVSCDARYRTPYGRGVAHTIAAHLADAGYQAGSGTPVVLLGYSGGAQAASAAVPFLSEALGRPPLTLVFIGGFHDGTSDLTTTATVHALVSRTDVIERFGTLIFPARWKCFPGSAWNIARRRGAVVEHDLSPARHFGPRSYVSDLSDGGDASPLDATIDVLAGLLAAPASESPLRTEAPIVSALAGAVRI